MSNHLLEETYDIMRGVSPIDPLLTESPDPEQIWLEKNIITPLSTLISVISTSRGTLPTYLSREKVKLDMSKLEKMKQSYLDIWHGIEDVKTSNLSHPNNIPTPQPGLPSITPNKI